MTAQAQLLGLIAPLLLLALVVTGERHRVPSRQRKVQTPHGALHHAKACDGEYYCTHHHFTAKSNLHTSKVGAPMLMATGEWEGTSVYDMPFTMDYVIDVAVNSEEEAGAGGTWGYYSTIMDTGSADLGLSVVECASCGLGLSTLTVDYISTSCIAVIYGDTEEDSTYWSGYQSTPVLAGFVSSNMSMTTLTSFAAITNASTGSMAFFAGGYTGILGLAYPGIAETYYDCETEDTIDADTPLLDSLYKAGKLDSNVFQITFCGSLAPLVVGGVDESDFKGTMVYTPAQKLMGKVYGYYLAYVEDFQVGGQYLDGVDLDDFNLYGGMIVDSGTTEVILPTQTYVAFAKYLLRTIDFIDESFFASMACLLPAALPYMPGLTFEFKGGITLSLSSRNYLIYYEGCYYWGVSSSTMAILGNVGMQGLSVAFDRDKNLIGFAAAACEDGVEVTGPGMEDTATTSTSRHKRHTTTARAASTTAPVTVTTKGHPNSLYRRWPSTKAQATHQALMEMIDEEEEEELQSPLPPPPPYRHSSSGSTLKSALIAGGISLVAIGLAIMIRRRRWPWRSSGYHLLP